jgi:hypothetical protein
VDLDLAQRRRIKARLGDRLAALWPHEAEVQRHLALLQGQLMGLASGLAGGKAGGACGACGAGPKAARCVRG